MLIAVDGKTVVMHSQSSVFYRAFLLVFMVDNLVVSLANRCSIIDRRHLC